MESSGSCVSHGVASWAQERRTHAAGGRFRLRRSDQVHNTWRLTQSINLERQGSLDADEGASSLPLFRRHPAGKQAWNEGAWRQKLWQ